MGRKKISNYSNNYKCLTCKKDGFRNKPNRKFCSKNCYYIFRAVNYKQEKSPSWKGGICNTEIKCLQCKKIVKRNIHRKFCSRVCHYHYNQLNGIKARAKNGMWKGGRIGGNGMYISLLLPEHPYARKNGYVHEHRVIMESKIGRYLLEDEVVHHINEKKDDNRISNLMLMNKKEHDKFHLHKRRVKLPVTKK